MLERTTLLWWSLVCLGPACSGDDGGGTTDRIVPADTDVDTDTDLDTDTGTVTEGGYIDAEYFQLSGRFGFDEEVSQFVPWVDPDLGPQPIRITVWLIDGTIAETGVLDSSNSCPIDIELDAPLDVAPWSDDAGAWAAFELPATADIVNGCAAYRFPGEWDDDPVAAVSQWAFGMGVTTLDPDTEELLRESLPASEWAAAEPYLVGGLIYSDLFPVGGLEDTLTDQVAFGYEVDGNFEVEIGGTGNPVPIEARFVNAPGGIATGYYEVDSGLFTPGSLLTLAPVSTP